MILHMRRDVRVVEGARLESVCRGNSTVGSNPTLSANLRQTLTTFAATVGRPRRCTGSGEGCTPKRSRRRALTALDGEPGEGWLRPRPRFPHRLKRVHW